jgi:hypothetical protein
MPLRGPVAEHPGGHRECGGSEGCEWPQVREQQSSPAPARYTRCVISMAYNSGLISVKYCKAILAMTVCSTGSRARSGGTIQRGHVVYPRPRHRQICQPRQALRGMCADGGKSEGRIVCPWYVGGPVAQQNWITGHAALTRSRPLL